MRSNPNHRNRGFAYHEFTGGRLHFPQLPTTACRHGRQPRARRRYDEARTMTTFKAIFLTKADNQFSANLSDIDERALPDADVSVGVTHSCLNYKDALAITNHAPVVRRWPMIPGIDSCGIVTSSRDARFTVGDAVFVNGWETGEIHWGGLAQQAKFKGDWLLPLPQALTPQRAMAIGTAGHTAMLSVLALERHGIAPNHGDVLVTGACGGVAGVAILLLSRFGYRVVASTGRLAEGAYLTDLGAAEVIDRATLSAPGKPLQAERYAAVIDTVGSHTLVNACAQLKYGAAAATCGMAQGLDMPGTVAPFILRGVSLYGIQSSLTPLPLRRTAWARLVTDLDLAKLDAMTTVIPLARAIPTATAMIQGRIRGRVVVDTSA